ncbi:hypothetical protein Tco_0604177 [Tanacetum coccineum]
MVEGVMAVMPITFVEDKAQRRLEVKARITLMMGILDEHQLKFNSIKDAKMFAGSCRKEICSEMLHQSFDRLQKLVKFINSSIRTGYIICYRLIQRNLTDQGFPAQSVGSSNTDVLESPCLLVLITRERLKADNTNLAIHLPRACLMLAQAGFPSSL